MPGRQFASNAYRYGFNGKEKVDEIGVEGGDLDFGARIYDSRIGRWLSLDPHAGKYAGLTPLCFSFNNPIIFNDPDGKDGRLTIDYEHHTVTLETTVFVYGADKVDYDKVINSYNQNISNLNTIYNVEKGNANWTVSVKVNYVFNKDLNQELQAMGIGANQGPHDNTEKAKKLFEKYGFKAGDNALQLNPSLFKLENGVSDKGGNSAGVFKNNFWTAFHETLHMLGFDERYNAVTSEEIDLYKTDALSNSYDRSELMKFHFFDILEYAISKHNESGTYPEITTIVNVPRHMEVGKDGIKTEVLESTQKHSELRIDETNGGTECESEEKVKEKESHVSTPKK